MPAIGNISNPTGLWRKAFVVQDNDTAAASVTVTVTTPYLGGGLTRYGRILGVIGSMHNPTAGPTAWTILTVGLGAIVGDDFIYESSITDGQSTHKNVVKIITHDASVVGNFAHNSTDHWGGAEITGTNMASTFVVSGTVCEFLGLTMFFFTEP
jgi:hypothetical protein